MKKILYTLFGTCVFVFALTMTNSANAESVDVPTPNTPPSAEESGAMRPPAIPVRNPVGDPSIIREKLRAEYETRTMRNVRNDVGQGDPAEPRVVQGAMATSTDGRILRVRPAPEKDMETVRTNLLGSSTVKDLLNRRMEYLRDGKAMRLEAFRIRKENIMRQLRVGLDNLRDIRARVESRIEKIEAAGRDATEARRLLAVADSKITAAEEAVRSVANISPVTGAATSTSESDEVDLEKPREIAADAIDALKEAKRSINDVVVAIAKAMGLKIGADKTSSSTEPATNQ